VAQVDFVQHHPRLGGVLALLHAVEVALLHAGQHVARVLPRDIPGREHEAAGELCFDRGSGLYFDRGRHALLLQLLQRLLWRLYGCSRSRNCAGVLKIHRKLQSNGSL